MKRSKAWRLGVAGAFALAGAGLTFGVAAADSPAKAPLTRTVADFVLPDQNLVSHDLYALRNAKAIVLITQMNGCPIIRNIMPALASLQARYRSQGVEFMMLNSAKQDTRADILSEAKEWKINLPILLDHDQRIGRRLGVSRTAEVFVINPKTWTLVYHGPIDDRVTYERQKAVASENYAADAIDAAMAGKTVKVAERLTEGCLINFDPLEKSAGK